MTISTEVLTAASSGGEGAVPARPFVEDVAAMPDRRELIGRAKTMLMSAHGMAEPEAYRWIQKSAMDTRTSMTVIATRIVEAHGNSSHRQQDLAAS